MKGAIVCCDGWGLFPRRRPRFGPGVSRVSQKHGALLVVDDAHGIGVLGENGAGLLEELNLLGKVPLVTGTLSKAFGSIGGYVSGRKELIDYIRYYAGSCCFSVSLPPPCLAAALKSLELIQKATSERKRVVGKSSICKREATRSRFLYDRFHHSYRWNTDPEL